jgi:hypothetical protein
MSGTLTLESWPQATGFDTASYLARFIEQMQCGIIGDPPGVVPYNGAQTFGGSYANEFKVVGDATGMQVKVNQGRAFCKGFFAHLQDAAVTSGVYALAVTAAHASNDRIDTVVIEFSLSTGVATLKIVDGTAATPGAQVPGALTQSTATWQIPLTYVFVTHAVATIAAADVCDIRQFTETQYELARIAGFENPIIDGGMEVWNDGTTFTSIADGTVGPEMFAYKKSGVGVHDLLQSADVPAVADNVQKDNFSLHLDVTTIDATIATTDLYAVEHRIEGRRAKRCLQRGFTLPFWAKDSVIGPHAVAFLNSGKDRSFVQEYVITAVDTWQLFFAHVPASPTAGTWDYTTGTGLRVVWPVAVGPTYQTTPGAWQTGEFYGTARTVNGMSSTANNFKLWGVGRMVPGNLVLPFQPHDDEATLTKFYYEVIAASVATQTFGAGFASTTTTLDVDCGMTEKRVAPALSIASAASDFQTFTGAGAIVCTALTILGVNAKKLLLRATVAAGLTIGQGGHLLSVNANAKIKLNARLS